MSTLVFTPASHSGSHGNASGYLGNVARAARGLLAALLAVSPEQAEAAPSVQAVAHSASRVKDVATLYRMARQYDSVMPNLASELRSFAARD